MFAYVHILYVHIMYVSKMYIKCNIQYRWMLAILCIVYNVYMYTLYLYECIHRRIGGCTHRAKFSVQVLFNHFILLNILKRVTSKILNL